MKSVAKLVYNAVEYSTFVIYFHDEKLGSPGNDMLCLMVEVMSNTRLYEWTQPLEESLKPYHESQFSLVCVGEMYLKKNWESTAHQRRAKSRTRFVWWRP